MNVGNIGATTYNAWIRRGEDTTTKGTSSQKFSEIVGNQDAATNLVLHGVSEYSCYLSDTGKYANAETAFMRSLPAGDDMSQFGLQSFDDIYSVKVDWMRIIKGWMDMQYSSGNMKGYLDFKGFYDFLEK